jgi:DUF438 domain-containing protein
MLLNKDVMALVRHAEHKTDYTFVFNSVMKQINPIDIQKTSTSMMITSLSYGLKKAWDTLKANNSPIIYQSRTPEFSATARDEIKADIFSHRQKSLSEASNQYDLKLRLSGIVLLDLTRNTPTNG